MLYYLPNINYEYLLQFTSMLLKMKQQNVFKWTDIGVEVKRCWYVYHYLPGPKWINKCCDNTFTYCLHSQSLILSYVCQDTGYISNYFFP